MRNQKICKEPMNVVARSYTTAEIFIGIVEEFTFIGTRKNKGIAQKWDKLI
ncbi:MAG: hypothetical protein N2235_00240 [Fischerella sp.]|nr:hypothetical protein [Fischerella sp.]